MTGFECFTLRLQACGLHARALSFQEFEPFRLLFLYIAVTFRCEGGCVVLVGALPGLIVGHFAKDLQVERTAGEREHRHRFAHPNIVLFEPILETTDLALVVMVGQDQVRLHPGYPLAGLDQQLRDALSRHSAILIELVAAFVRDALDPAFHRNGVRLAE